MRSKNNTVKIIIDNFIVGHVKSSIIIPGRHETGFDLFSNPIHRDKHSFRTNNHPAMENTARTSAYAPPRQERTGPC